MIILVTPVYAADGGVNNGGGGRGGSRTGYGDILQGFTNAISDFATGEIDYDTFTRRWSEATGQLSENVGSGMMGIFDTDYADKLFHEVGETVSRYGLSAPSILWDWWTGILDKFKKSEQKPDFDLGGDGAIMVHFYGTAGFHLYRGSYGVFHGNTASLFGNYHTEYWNGDFFNASDPRRSKYNESWYNPPTIANLSRDPSEYRFYGDWRYEDDTQAPTDDTFTTVTDFNYDDLTDKELEDLLMDLLSEIKDQQPDLSSLEGLLEAIYNRLGHLDSDDDNGILNEINQSILALAKDKNDNTELMDLLKDIKDAIKDSKGEYDTEVFEDMANELKDISSTLKGLLAVEIVDDFLELTESEAKLFDAYADLVYTITKKLGFSVVSGAMSNIEVIIFTTTPPQDVAVNIWGDRYTILTASMFDSEALKYITIAKTFISILILYSWCMMMRRKLAGGE